MRREEPGADRAAAARPGRDPGGGVPGGAAAQRDAGSKAARGHTAGERAGGERRRELKRNAQALQKGSWREGDRTRNVHLGSSMKMDAEAARQKARKMKVEVLE